MNPVQAMRIGSSRADLDYIHSLDTASLAESYRICQALHRRHGTTYYRATRTLPRIKQHHVHALYGLARFADEIVDAFDGASVADRRRRLEAFQGRAMEDLALGNSSHPVLKAVVFTARAWDLPSSAFSRFFSAMAADLTVTSYATYDDLARYMDGSAAVIGEMMFPILEPRSPDAFEGARNLGIAFQLTNFLRDVGEDLDRGRVYFPSEELEGFGVDIAERSVTPEWRAFCEFQIERMQHLYASADRAIPLLPPDSARAIRAARTLYSEILDQIQANDYDVFHQRVRVPLLRKVTVAGRELARK